MFFVVTTGRSGSHTIAYMLSQHPFCFCVHERHPIFAKLAAERLYNQISDDELLQCLGGMFTGHVRNRFGLGMLYGESDQKLSFLIPHLARKYPEAKFIWLIRDGRNTVTSMASLGNYGHHDVKHKLRLWAKYRLQGDLCGDVESKLWEKMSVFEKCCWYWSFTNRVIERDLKKLDDSSWMMLRLENLADCFDDVRNFLDLPFYPFRLLKANKSKVTLHRFGNWTEEEKKSFNRLCGEEMDCWYPDWRVETKTSQTSKIGRLHNKTTVWPRAITSHVKWFARKGIRKLKPGNASSTSVDMKTTRQP